MTFWAFLDKMLNSPYAALLFVALTLAAAGWIMKLILGYMEKKTPITDKVAMTVKDAYQVAQQAHEEGRKLRQELDANRLRLRLAMGQLSVLETGLHRVMLSLSEFMAANPEAANDLRPVFADIRDTMQRMTEYEKETVEQKVKDVHD